MWPFLTMWAITSGNFLIIDYAPFFVFFTYLKLYFVYYALGEHLEVEAEVTQWHDFSHGGLRGQQPWCFLPSLFENTVKMCITLILSGDLIDPVILKVNNPLSRGSPLDREWQKYLFTKIIRGSREKQPTSSWVNLCVWASLNEGLVGVSLGWRMIFMHWSNS